MKNKAQQPKQTLVSIRLHNHLVAEFNKRMAASGIAEETEAWYDAQKHFFNAALAVYDFFDLPDKLDATLYIESQLEYRGIVCEIGTE